MLDYASMVESPLTKMVKTVGDLKQRLAGHRYTGDSKQKVAGNFTGDQIAA